MSTALQPHALILEDEEIWRVLFSEALQGEGFFVDAAANPRQAAEFAAENLYHLLVLDTNMAPLDRTNQQGIDFLRSLHESGQAKALAVIVISGFGDEERLRHYFEDFQIAAFRSKGNFDQKELAQLATSLLSTRLQISLALKIHWEIDPADAFKNLRVFDGRIKASHPLFGRLQQELTDLLCRLFHNANEIVVQPMKRGRSGAGVLLVQPFYTRGAARPVVLKFGEARQIEREAENFEQYVKGFLGRSTTIDAIGRTPLLGGIVYSLLGVTKDEFEDFGSFYSHSTVAEVKRVLDDLFANTCRSWYSSPGNLMPHNLTTEYLTQLDLSPEKLEEPLSKGLKSVQGKERLHFNSMTRERTFPNPLAAMANREIVRATYECVTHGDLNAGNIFVDANASTWLIDFLRTGPGHILRDFAELDTTIRILLLAAEEATLDERLDLEEALLQARRFSEVPGLSGRLQSGNKTLQKCYESIVHLRSLAADLVKHNIKDDLTEYYTGLLLLSLNLIRFWDLPTLQREHALLAAALLSERMVP